MTRIEKALSILKQASRSGSRPGLERISELCALLGDPQDRFRAVHVAGTNGKGSFCAMLSSVLGAQGYGVGTFSSPVMLRYNDCIRLGGEPVSEDVFAGAVIKADKASAQMTDKPTEFELLTAAAFLIFAEQGCDFAVIECGMGGRGDSTNVLKAPVLSVITNVTLDHCAFLGDTVADIAAQKAGIIKAGRPVFLGRPDKEVFDVVKREADLKGSELYTPDEDILFRSENGFTYRGRELTLPLKGAYQAENLRNVLSCIELLRTAGVSISDDAVVQGIAAVRWEGRFERLWDDPPVIFDGAHNPDGMTALCESIRTAFPDTKPAVLIGVLSDKDYRLYAKKLCPLISQAFTITPDNPRALPAKKLAEALSSEGIPAGAYLSIGEGFEAAFGHCRESRLPLLVIGSLYLYKDIIAQIKNICK
ncbi:MAG: bifunctional folylpolyglutamate synthase/dihydrofolate synthase [Ruminococcus sp.]|nr:bifunctional folylpolyglutamate synthase/dihydrofolate synthase [Ruminococcus sp.]